MLGLRTAPTSAVHLSSGVPARLAPSMSAWCSSRSDSANLGGPGRHVAPAPLPVEPVPQSEVVLSFVAVISWPLEGVRNRAYDPTTGRWLSRDPIGELRGETINLYDHGALLLTRTGIRLPEREVRRWFRALNAERGPAASHLYPHLFRHSIAVHLLRGGADIRQVQQFLGHANVETTKVYLRLVPGHLREEYDAAMPVIAVAS